MRLFGRRIVRRTRQGIGKRGGEGRAGSTLFPSSAGAFVNQGSPGPKHEASLGLVAPGAVRERLPRDESRRYGGTRPLRHTLSRMHGDTKKRLCPRWEITGVGGDAHATRKGSSWVARPWASWGYPDQKRAGPLKESRKRARDRELARAGPPHGSGGLFPWTQVYGRPRIRENTASAVFAPFTAILRGCRKGTSSGNRARGSKVRFGGGYNYPPHRGLIGGARPLAAAIETKKLTKSYKSRTAGKINVVEVPRPSRRRGRDLRIPRAERRGQDDHDQDAPRASSTRPLARATSSARRSATWRSTA